MHVEKGITGRYAISLADLDVSSKGNSMGWPFPGSGGDGRIDALVDACVWLPQVRSPITRVHRGGRAWRGLVE